MMELIAGGDVQATSVGTGEEALNALKQARFDCMVLDLRLPDMTGVELLERVQAEPSLARVPVVVFTGKELDSDEEKQLKAVAKSIVLKDVQSPERLLDETSLFLHRVVTQLPVIVYGSGGDDTLSHWKRRDGVFALREARSMERLMDTIYFFVHRSTASMSEDERRALEELHTSHRVLEKKRALLVDDDMRNIFALATVLDEEGMEVVSANNGRDAISIVQRDAEIDIVLMDIMMPEMDGITTIQEIRKLPRGHDLPIIAVTAKAMKGDREKCIEAGAWDYLSKPVDRLHLLSVLRGWLHR
jgi:CheY-like chemotaxis protein